MFIKGKLSKLSKNLKINWIDKIEKQSKLCDQNLNKKAQNHREIF